MTALLQLHYHTLTWLQQAVAPTLGGQSSWVAIVLLTVTVQVLLLPLAVRQARSVRAQRVLRPQLNKLQARYGKRPEQLHQARMALYRAHGGTPSATSLMAAGGARGWGTAPGGVPTGSRHGTQ